MTNTHKLAAARDRIQALAKKRRGKAARATRHAPGRADVSQIEHEAAGLEIAVSVIDDVLAQ